MKTIHLLLAALGLIAFTGLSGCADDVEAVRTTRTTTTTTGGVLTPATSTTTTQQRTTVIDD